MDNQHRKIRGYRELTQAEIDLMNRIKALGPLIEAVLVDVRDHIGAQYRTADREEIGRLNEADPLGWLRNAQDDLQTGLMKTTRAVAQPSFF